MGDSLIKEEAFEDNEKIKQVFFPSSLTEIGDCAFSGCGGIKEIRLNGNLEEIGYDAFRGTHLTEVEIPEKVVTIGCTAFNCNMKVSTSNRTYADKGGVLFDYSKTKLKIYPSSKASSHYEVRNGVEEIGFFAFEDSNLQSLTLPKTINVLQAHIFCGCTKMTELTIKVEDPSTVQIDKDAFKDFDRQRCTLIVPSGCKAIYAAHPMFKGFMKIVEKGGEKVQKKEKEPSKENHVEKRMVGQSFTVVPEPMRTVSKPFFYRNGENKCFIEMTTKALYLKVRGGCFYLLTEIDNKFTFGQIWIHNKKGNLSSYKVSFSTDNKTSIPFGSFTETQRSLTYKDGKTGKSFTINL